MEWDNICAAKYQGGSKHSRKIEGQYNQYPEYFTDCLLAEGNNFQLFTRGNSLSVSFAGESHAHAIRGVECVSHACIYMPSRDYLITTINARGIGGTPIIVYKNFIRNLQKQRILYPNLQSEVAFNASPDPDLVLSARFDSGSYTATTVWMQRSVNDRWLVFEIVGVGIFRMDMDTYQTIKVADFRTNYWSLGPNIDFDITGDGQHIAIFGFNSLNAIYEITPGCGAVIPDSPTYMQLISPEGGTNCPYLSLPEMFSKPNGVLHMPNFGAAHQPRFSDDGGEISFYTLPYQGSSDPPRHITLRASGYTGPKPLDYLALGDSYSSGEGDTENDSHGSRFYRQFTNTLGTAGEPKERCHISTRSYPYILAQGMNLSLNSEWNTVACSGATAWDVKAQGSLAYAGQNNRLKGFNVEALKFQSLNEFIPGRQKQIEFVRKYKPKVITLTMGGNDIGFADKVRACVTSIGSCDYVNGRRNVLAKEIRDQYDNLLSLYKELFKASDSKAKIYVLGYPNFVNGDPNASCDLNIGALNAEERELFKNGVAYLNNVIQQAALAAGVKYIDIENSLNGHRLCDSGNKYITSVTDFTNFSSNRQESFHPNAKGNFEIAMSVWDALGHADLGSMIICPNGDIVCPDTGATKESIVTPQYFNGLDTEIPTRHKQMTFYDFIQGSVVSFTLPSFSFAKNSSVSVVLHSNPIDIGTFIADEIGGLSVSTIIPLGVPVGYHTLLVSGTSFTGDPIEYEQTILVLSADQKDIDNDDVIDSFDKCLLVEPSDQDSDKDGVDDACDPEIILATKIEKNITPPLVKSVGHTEVQKSQPSYEGGSLHDLLRTLITLVINSYIGWSLFILKIMFLLIYR